MINVILCVSVRSNTEAMFAPAKHSTLSWSDAPDAGHWQWRVESV